MGDLAKTCQENDTEEILATVQLTHATRRVLCFIRDQEFLIPDFEVADVRSTRTFLKGVFAIHHFSFHEPTAIESRYCQYLVNRNKLEKEL